ncbi:TPA: galactosyltransferase-related protein, partial [Escherichia coli]
ESLINYVDYIISNDYKFSTLCLYRDFTKSKHDYSIRSFPTLYDFLCSFLLGVNKSKIKKENILSDTVVDWCAGSFMLIHALSFLNVNGFDQKYFMYCEDIDLCMRLKLSGVDLYYTPHFDAIHYAQHENRRIFTKAFRWHIRSITRYILRKPILSYKNYRKITSELV